MNSFLNLRKYNHTRNNSHDDKKIKFYTPLKDFTIKDHYDMSLMSNKTEILNLINAKKEELPMNQFKEFIKDILKEYKIKKIKDSDSDLDEQEEIYDYQIKRNNRFKNQKLLIEKQLEKNSRLLNGSSDMSLLKINVKKQLFKNPYESLDVIKENEKIYTDICHRYKERQKQFYENAQSKVAKITVKLPNIKVRNLIKPIDIIRHEIKEDKKTDTGQVKLYDLSNPFIVEKQLPKLFCSYMYSNKNFPEGREQFAFVFNSEDIVLYSGLSSTKNNYVWTMNPGKFSVYFRNYGME